jgi:hypothetical protein
VQEGRLTPDTLIRKGEEGPWAAARQVKGLFEGVPQTPETVPQTPVPTPTPAATPFATDAQDDMVPVEAVRPAAVNPMRPASVPGSPQTGVGAVYCQRCGQPAHASQYQCASCGSPLRPPQTDNTLGGLIPTGNPKSLWAYYLAYVSVLGCFPVIGVVIGLPAAVAALVMGLKARRYAIEHPEAKGGAHAWFGILTGAVCLILGILVQALTVIGIVVSMLDKR